MKKPIFESSYTKYIKKDGTVSLYKFERWKVETKENGIRIRLYFKTENEALFFIHLFNIN